MPDPKPAPSGALPIHEFDKCATEVLRAVRETGRVVPLTRHGRVVALLRPVPSSVGTAPYGFAADGEVPTTRLTRIGISQSVKQVENGGTLVITFWNRPAAILSSASAWPEMDQLFDEDRGDGTGRVPGRSPTPSPS